MFSFGSWKKIKNFNQKQKISKGEKKIASFSFARL